METPRLYKTKWGLYIYFDCDSLETASRDEIRGPGLLVERARYIEAVERGTGKAKVLKVMMAPAGTVHEESTEENTKAGFYPDYLPRPDVVKAEDVVREVEGAFRAKGWPPHLSPEHGKVEALEREVKRLQGLLTEQVEGRKQAEDAELKLQEQVKELERGLVERESYAEGQASLVESWSDALGLEKMDGYDKAEEIREERDRLRDEVKELMAKLAACAS